MSSGFEERDRKAYFESRAVCTSPRSPPGLSSTVAPPSSARFTAFPSIGGDAAEMEGPESGCAPCAGVKSIASRVSEARERMPWRRVSVWFSSSDSPRLPS
jgi:hypothetical protein